MQDLWSLSTYTRELKRRLPQTYFRPVPGRLWWMVPHLAVVIGSIAAIASGRLPWPAELALGLVIGLSFGCLAFLGHEILHGSIVSGPLLRNVLGGICFAPFCVGACLWHKWHVVEHHGQTQIEGKDPDAMGTLESYGGRAPFFLLPLRAQSVVVFLGFGLWFTSHSLISLQRYYRDFRPLERPVVLAQFLGPLAFWLTLGGLIGGRAFAFAYVLPLAVGNALLMSHINTNHMLSPLTPINDPLINALTVTMSRWRSVLLLGFGYHVEHHIFPSMSPRYAPEVQRHLKELWPERYQELPHGKALLGLWRTPRVYHDNEHLFEPRRGLLYPVLGSGLDPDHVVGVPPA